MTNNKDNISMFDSISLKTRTNEPVTTKIKKVNRKKIPDSQCKSFPPVQMTLGPTGSGKTHSITENLIKSLKEPTSNNITIVALSSKEAVSIMSEEIRNAVNDEEHLKKLCIYISGSSYSTKGFIVLSEESKAIKGKNKNKIYTSPRVILTTHAYLKKRGDSSFMYMFHLDLLWLRNEQKYKIDLIIDEGHLFLNSLTWSYKVGGLYYDHYDLGNSVIERPLKGVKNLNQVSDKVSRTMVYKETPHIFTVDMESKNPIVKWDTGFSPGQHRSIFPDLGNPSTTVKHLNMQYDFIENSSFKSDHIMNLGYKYALSAKSAFSREILTSFCKRQSVNLVAFTDYDYSSAMSELFACTPYFIRTTNIGDEAYDGEPRKTQVSGYDFYTLTLILSLFDHVTLTSASFTDQHYLLWECLGLKVEKETLPTREGLKDDFGCVLVNNKRMTLNNFKDISTLGPMLHFSHNKKESESLSNNFFKDPTLRYKFASLEKVYRKVYERLDTYDTPENLGEKTYLLSYWGSSLSTGVNLPELNVCCVDLKHSIPFVFIPMDLIKSDGDLLAYITESLCESVIQMLSRICRNHGDSFKVLILNRANYNESEKGLIDELVKYKRFAAKFKKFKIFKDIKFSKPTLSYLEYLIQNNIPLKRIPSDVLEMTSINSDLVDYLQGLDHDISKSLVNTVPKSQSSVKLMVKNSTKPNDLGWIQEFDIFKHYAVKLTISHYGFHFSFSNLNNSKIVGVNFTESSDLSQEYSKLKEILKKDVILFGFNSNMFEGPVLSYLMTKNSSDLNIKDALLECENLLTKERVSLKSVENSVFKFIDLRIMCKQHNRITLDEIASQLNYFDLPDYTLVENELTSDVIEQRNEHSINILKMLQSDLFSEDNVLVYNSFLNMLKQNFSYDPTFDQILRAYISTPTKKWTSQYIPALSLNHYKPVISESEHLLNTSDITNYIEELFWHDISIKDKLIAYYGNESFYSFPHASGFRNENKEEMTLNLIFNNSGLSLKMGSGGCHSKIENTIVKQDSDVKMFDMDIQGFYGWILYQFKLLKGTPVQLLLNHAYENRLKALKENDYHSATAYKFIINSISGNLSLPYSPLYNIQSRFDLIQLSQIIVCNWIDFLIKNSCSVFAVNTDGLIITIPKDASMDFVHAWASGIGVTVKMLSLEWFSAKGGQISKMTLEGNFSGSGMNLEKSITPFTSFRYNKPLILKDIIEGKSFPKGNVPSEELRKFVYTAATPNLSNPLFLQDENDYNMKEIKYIRYVIGRNTKINLMKKMAHGYKSIHNSIIYLNSYREIKYEDLDEKHYKNTALSEINSIGDNITHFAPFQANQNVLTKTKNENIIHTERFNLELKKSFESFHKSVDLVPVRNGGKFFRGKLKDNIITFWDNSSNYEALAVVIDPNKYFVIDVDDNLMLPDTIRAYLLSNYDKLCICYHSKKDLGFEQVLNFLPFKLIFKCDTEIVKQMKSLISNYEKIKIEIAFNRAFSFFGYHRKKESEYKLLGGVNLNNMQFPDKELIDLLFEELPTDFSSITKSNQFSSKGISLEKTRRVMKSFQKKYGGEKMLVKEDNSERLVSTCPNNHLHTSGKSHSREFSIKYSLKFDTVVAGCFHRSCRENNLKLLEDLFNLEDKPTFEELNVASIGLLSTQTSNDVSIEKLNDTLTGTISTEKLSDVTIKQSTKYQKLKDELTFLLNTKNSDKGKINSLRANIRYYKNNYEKLKVESKNPRDLYKDVSIKQLTKYQKLKDELTLLSNTKTPDRGKINSLRANLRYYEKNLKLPSN
jgi:hypothetical protein